MNIVVLDASALLAFLNREKGVEFVDGVLSRAVISSVNLTEVVSKIAERGMPFSKIRIRIQNILKQGLKVIPLNHDDAVAAGILRVETQSLGLSLGDRCCLALGERLKAAILTTERAWTKLDQKRFFVLKIR